MAERYKVQGLVELRDTLLTLPKELRGRPLRNALFSAGKVIRDEAIRLAPVKSGRLRRNIVVSPARSSELTALDAGVVVTVRTRRKKSVAGGKLKLDDSNNAYYARFLEFGHAARTRKSLRNVQRRAVKAVGSALGAIRFVAARPFLRPAFETRKQEALNRFIESFREALDKAVEKLARVSR